MKKFVLYPFLVLLSVFLSYAGAVLFTPLPYLPLNHLLKNSDDLSGKISGNLYSGVRIKVRVKSPLSPVI